MAAPAYSYRNSRASYVPGSAAPKRSGSPRVSTVAGERPQQRTTFLPSSVGFLAGAIAVALVVITAVCFVRIYLSSETVTSTMAVQKAEASIAQARSDGSALEVQSSVMTSVASVKDRAKAIGMIEPEFETAIVLSPDVVVTNADGSLSLAESIRIACTAV